MSCKHKKQTFSKIVYDPSREKDEKSLKDFGQPISITLVQLVACKIITNPAYSTKAHALLSSTSPSTGVRWGI